jgi:hypothetical protein
MDGALDKTAGVAVTGDIVIFEESVNPNLGLRAAMITSIKDGSFKLTGRCDMDGKNYRDTDIKEFFPAHFGRANFIHIKDGLRYESYENQDFRFRLKYPAAYWIVRKDSVGGAENDELSMLLECVPIKTEQYGKTFKPSIGIIAQKIPDDMAGKFTVQEFTRMWSAKLPQGIGNVIDVKPDRIKVFFNRSTADGDFAGEDVFIVRRGYCYYVQFCTYPDEYESTKYLFDDFMKKAAFGYAE